MLKDEMRNIEKSDDIALYSYIFEREKETFTIPEIRSELYKKGIELTNADIQERVKRFVALGFVCQEYREYVRCNL